MVKYKQAKNGPKGEFEDW